MQFEEISELIVKYIMGTACREEETRLRHWIEQDEVNKKLFDKLTNPQYVRDKIARWDTLQLPEMPEAKVPAVKPGRRSPRLAWRIAAAAILSAAFVTGGIFLNRSDRRYQNLKEQFDKEQYLASIKPGVTQATLTTESGRTIVLGNDEESNREAIAAARARQERATALRKKAEADRSAINNLEIPRGGEFHIILEDGTDVWLNAESSLKYPEHFDGKTREVSLVGEAYFKVAKDVRLRPFRVKTAGQVVQVYGTEFNIFSYFEDDFVYTTLVNGCISLMREDCNDSELILTPGHQAVFEKQNRTTKVKSVATDVVTSWRNGMFVFEDQTLDQIMRQLSRWYNFTYTFTSEEVANTIFMGRMARTSKFGDVLEILEQSGHLKFDVKDNNIIISKSTNP